MATPTRLKAESVTWWSREFRSVRRRKDLLTAFLFLAPSVLAFAVFTYYALGFNMYLSLTSWNFISDTKKFIGLDNYINLFNSARFLKVILNTTFFSVGSVVISLVLGLFFAVLLNKKIPGRGLLRTVIFSPYITTTAAVALLWVWIFDPSYGLINYALEFIGLEGPRWLSSIQFAMPALIIMEVWKVAGYAMVIFLAGLTNIPSELYEAAEIDGAGGWVSFWHITLPLLSPTTFFLIVTSLVNAFKVFDQVAVMTLGGPVDATKVFNFYIYELAFINFKAGYASAAAMVLFFILLILTLMQIVFSRKWVYYQ